MTPSSPSSSSNSSSTGPEQLSKTNLYIRGLPPATTDLDLVKLCHQWVHKHCNHIIMYAWDLLVLKKRDQQRALAAFSMYVCSCKTTQLCGNRDTRSSQMSSSSNPDVCILTRLLHLHTSSCIPSSFSHKIQKRYNNMEALLHGLSTSYLVPGFSRSDQLTEVL